MSNNETKPQIDSEKSARDAVEASELFEQYFTHVEPQPMGTPKQIFRMGYAQGQVDYHKSGYYMELSKRLTEAQAQLKKAEASLKIVMHSPTWPAKHTDGSPSNHTYKASTVSIAREYFADKELK